MSTTKYFYIVAVIVCLVAVYYIYQAENQMQPQVYMTYNAASQLGIGYINNTLQYPIEVTTIYCTAPNGNRQTFGTPNNNILMPRSNTVIEIGISSNVPLALNCTNWKISYNRLPANTTAPNSPIVQKS
jgi:hypothetical protein